MKENSLKQLFRPLEPFNTKLLKWQRKFMWLMPVITELVKIEDHIKRLEEKGLSPQDAKLQGAQEYAIECAVLKVFCSELVQFVSDESLQVYGGMGFSAESEVEACYRDARISRIYEGTNEINRLLIVKMILKTRLL